MYYLTLKMFKEIDIFKKLRQFVILKKDFTNLNIFVFVYYLKNNKIN